MGCGTSQNNQSKVHNQTIRETGAPTTNTNPTGRKSDPNAPKVSSNQINAAKQQIRGNSFNPKPQVTHSNSFIPYEYRKICSDPRFIRVIQDPCEQNLEPLAQELERIKHIEDVTTFETQMICGTVGLIIQEGGSDHDINEIISIFKRNAQIGAKLFGADSPAVAENYDCMATQSSENPEILKEQLKGLAESLKIKAHYPESPELGKTHALLAFKCYFLEREENARENAASAIYLLAPSLKEYLFEFCLAAAFIGDHTEADQQAVGILKSKVPEMKELQKQLESKTYKPSRSFARIFLKQTEDIIGTAIQRIESGGYIIDEEE